jgi:hypothetical protein
VAAQQRGLVGRGGGGRSERDRAGRGPTQHAGHVVQDLPMDRRLAHKNLRTGLIAGAISLVIFASSFFVGLIYT